MRPGELSAAYTQMETGSQLQADPKAFLSVEIYEPTAGELQAWLMAAFFNYLHF